MEFLNDFYFKLLFNLNFLEYYMNQWTEVLSFNSLSILLFFKFYYIHYYFSSYDYLKFMLIKFSYLIKYSYFPLNINFNI